MAKVSTPVVFSDDSSNALTDVFTKFAQAKANLQLSNQKRPRRSARATTWTCMLRFAR